MTDGIGRGGRYDKASGACAPLAHLVLRVEPSRQGLCLVGTPVFISQLSDVLERRLFFILKRPLFTQLQKDSCMIPFWLHMAIFERLCDVG